MLAVEGFLRVTTDCQTKTLTLHMDRTKLDSAGKGAIEDLLLELTMWLITADIAAATDRYGSLTEVNEEWLEICAIVRAQPSKPRIFVQGNTFISETGDVEYREYEETPKGVIRSWAERVLSSDQ